LTPHSDRDIDLINGAKQQLAGGRAWLRKGREITHDENGLFLMALFPPYLELGAFVVTDLTARREWPLKNKDGHVIDERSLSNIDDDPESHFFLSFFVGWRIPNLST